MSVASLPQSFSSRRCGSYPTSQRESYTPISIGICVDHSRFARYYRGHYPNRLYCSLDYTGNGAISLCREVGVLTVIHWFFLLRLTY
eukprot:1195641-Prorocentrum_minimum.AAC.1